MRRSQTSIQPDFDWQQLRQLAGEDADFETELLTMFLADADDSLQQLGAAIASEDIQATEDLAHSLRGASANVGAIALAQVASQIENLARNGEVTGTAELLGQLHYYCQNIQLQLRNRA